MEQGVSFSNKNEYGRAFSETALLLSYAGAAYALSLLILTAATGGEFWRQFTTGAKTQSMSVAYVVTTYLLITSSVILFRSRMSRPSPAREAFLSGDAGRAATAGLLHGAALFSVFFAATSPFTRPAQTGPAGEAAVHALVNIVPSLLLAFTEEFIFRGVIFEISSRSLRITESIVMTSALFALAHMFCHGTLLYKAVYFLNLFLMSAIFCVGTIRFRNIWFSSFMHFAFVYLILMRNYLDFFMLRPECRGIIAGFDDSPMTGLAAAAIMAVVLVFRKRIFGEEK